MGRLVDAWYPLAPVITADGELLFCTFTNDFDFLALSPQA